MKTMHAILSSILFAIITYLAYVLDQWLGIAAYTYRYLLFCVICGGLYWVMWRPISKRYSRIIGLVCLIVLSANLAITAPSERILRNILIRIPLGSPVESIEPMVHEAYNGTRYVMPRITSDENRVHVSLLSQQPGNCTAIIFRIENDVVVDKWFSAD